jgi:hypothetical protein
MSPQPGHLPLPAGYLLHALNLIHRFGECKHLFDEFIWRYDEFIHRKHE